MPNFTFCGGRELKTTTFFLISRTSIQSYFEFNSRKICQIEQDGISASHIFKSDVFVAVAAVVAYKLPTFYRSLFTRARVFKSLFIGFFFFLHLVLGLVHMISITGKFTHILHFKRVGIIATAFGKTQNSKGEIFAAFAVVFAKAPYANSSSLSSLSALSTSEKYQFRFSSVILYQLFGWNLGFAEGNILQKNCKSVFVYFHRCRFWT